MDEDDGMLLYLCTREGECGMSYRGPGYQIVTEKYTIAMSKII
jgi:hypothetical protein